MFKKNNRKIKALFQMDPIGKLNFKSDSTILILKEAIRRGVNTFVCSPDDLTLINNFIYVNCKRVIFKDSVLTFKSDKRIKINKLDYFFIRQDPPFNLNYLTNCYLLELHQRFNKKPQFVNDPSGIKNFTEKIFPMYFHKVMPHTLVTSDERVFKEYLLKNNFLILKTLYNKGGEGVVKVSKNERNALKKFAKLKNTYGVPVVIQEFLSEVSDGDKRVILLNGEPAGLINRIPRKGHFKANLHLGGKAEVSKLTKKELEICRLIKPHLKKNKLFFVGIDLINEKLTEINVTSPTGIAQIKELSGINIAENIWDKLLKTP